MAEQRAGTRKGTAAGRTLALAVLGYLEERPMHPYEMCQLAAHRHEDTLVKVSPGSVYRAVYRLADEGLAESVGTGRDGARPERTTFAITDAGRLALREGVAALLASTEPEYPRFPVALAGASSLPEADVEEALTARLAARRAELAELDAVLSATAEHDVPRMYKLDAEYSRSQLSAEVAWIEGVIADLGTERLPWVDRRDPSERDRQYESARAIVLDA